MDVSLMIEGQMGLTWPRWKRLVADAEELGFAGLYRSDHFQNPRPPDQEALEMVTSLTYVATATSRIRFGPMVAPVSFRDPVQLARQAAAIDDLSGGRFVLGMGAGWMEREHDAFGYDLLGVADRFRRLEEALQVVRGLLTADRPFSFEGRFYRLHEAPLLPRPERAGGPPILVGGNGPRRSLPLAARYANVWNGIGALDGLRERNETLDRLLEAHGRAPSDVKRTVMISAHGDDVGDRIRAAENAGAGEVMLQWLTIDDVEGLRTLAGTVIS
jgi:F420-dependent oxidoreductase-like protein